VVERRVTSACVEELAPDAGEKPDTLNSAIRNIERTTLRTIDVA
jgi:hypothetical protein